MTTFVSSFSRRFEGVTGVPGDKSISHRALILSALAEGESRIEGLLESEDVLKTADALRVLGVSVTKTGGEWMVKGIGNGHFKNPGQALDFGNSGTSARLIAGVLAGQSITAILDGDQSLRKRPFGRIIAPLSEMGARFEPEGQKTLPLTIRGTASPNPITYKLPVPSAQVKSAILLAGLRGDGKTTIIEDRPTRDHTERMLKSFGADLEIAKTRSETRITLTGGAKLEARELTIPGDISSAAFPLAAALLARGGGVTVENVGVNPTRTGLLKVLSKMGAGIEISNRRDVCGEPVADIRARHGRLRGVATDAEIAPLMIDEFPVLFVLAAYAEGRSEFRGLEELRHKESDRLSLMAEGLKANGVEVEEFKNGLAIRGGAVEGGAIIDAGHDHRIAMAFLVLGIASRKPVTVKGAETISTSFPGFAKLMRGLGAQIEERL